MEAEWTWMTTVKAQATLARRKSTGKGEVSAEVLKALSAEALWSLHEMLKLLFETAHGNPLPWGHIRLYLLPSGMSSAASVCSKSSPTCTWQE